MSGQNLTKRQRETLDYLIEFTSEKGYSPTFDDIARRFGVSRTTAFKHAEVLQKKGVIARTHGTSRGIRVVGPPCESCNGTGAAP